MPSAELIEIVHSPVSSSQAGLHIVLRDDSPAAIIGRSVAMQHVRAQIRQVARTTASVLITGPSGTGKELVARAIHGLSCYRDGPFVAVNCAALPEALVESELFGSEKGAYTGADRVRAGCFELADNGTLFLDEVGEMSSRAQAKLLRVVEDLRIRRLGGGKEIAIALRIIASTKVNLPKAIRSGSFREDLYYRLNAFAIELPCLEARSDDIPALVHAMIATLNITHGQRVSGIESGALAILCSHSWPGNVRELRNVLERAIILAHEGVIMADHLFWSAATPLTPTRPYVLVPVGATVEDAKIALIRLTLRNTPNKTVAAQVLGISYKTLCGRITADNALGSAAIRERGPCVPEKSSAMMA